MPDSKLPQYAILVRWDKFKLDIVGKRQIGYLMVAVAALLGLRYLWPFVH